MNFEIILIINIDEFDNEEWRSEGKNGNGKIVNWFFGICYEFDISRLCLL